MLLINGKGVIHRKVHVNENDNPAALLNKVFPNVSLNEFTIQKTTISATEAFVSVIRTKILSEITEELVKNKLTAISGCFLGPFVINELLPLINTNAINNEQLTIGNYQLQIREQQITDVTAIESNDHQPVVVGDDNVSQQLLFAFAGALSYFTGNHQGISNSESIAQLKEEFSQKEKFEFRGKVLLTATFLVLLINYFVFDNYWGKSNQMNSQLALTESALKRYETLKVEYAQKKDFLEQNGLLENSRTSYYADQLASNLPATIQWKSLNIHPLKKKKASEETNVLFFENKLITISGSCERSTELNDWMKEIKKKDWISDVTMVNYQQDNAKEDGEFLIEVKLK